jgi:hypothetical protein
LQPAGHTSAATMMIATMRALAATAATAIAGASGAGTVTTARAGSLIRAAENQAIRSRNKSRRGNAPAFLRVALHEHQDSPPSETTLADCPTSIISSALIGKSAEITV